MAVEFQKFDNGNPSPETTPRKVSPRMVSELAKISGIPAPDQIKDTDDEPSSSDENSDTLDDEEQGVTALKMEAMSASADLVRVYLKEIGKTALLNTADEVELSKRIEAGLYAQKLLEDIDALPDDEKLLYEERRQELELVALDGKTAKNHMLEANLRLVVSLAKRYTDRGMSLLDLIQEGNLGLIHAMEKFDYTKGFKFSTYATWWIRQSITRSILERGRTIRLPLYYHAQVNKMKSIRRTLYQNLGREPTVDEIAVEMGIDTDNVSDLLKHSRDTVSLNTPVGENENTAELGDFIEDIDEPMPYDAAELSDRQDAVSSAIEKLTDREQFVIRLRFGLDGYESHTLDQIGKKIGLTRERIRQIERKALLKLKSDEVAAILREYA